MASAVHISCVASAVQIHAAHSLKHAPQHLMICASHQCRPSAKLPERAPQVAAFLYQLRVVVQTSRPRHAHEERYARSGGASPGLK